MTQLELKKNFHSLIDEIDDPKLLNYLYEFLIAFKERGSDADDNWWNNLTEEQKIDIDLAIKESENEKNWIPHEQVMKESKEWLKK